jgi:hypothetical protein
MRLISLSNGCKYSVRALVHLCLSEEGPLQRRDNQLYAKLNLIIPKLRAWYTRSFGDVQAPCKGPQPINLLATSLCNCLI